MQNERMHPLLQRLVDRMHTGTADEVAGMRTEDVDDFLSPRRAERERRQFFLETPQIVGFAGELREPGSYLTAEAMGVPVVVTRDAAGKLHAMVNACAHRGARVASGSGRRTTLSCRFHGWSYALDGSLRGRPRDECFSVAAGDCSLTRLPVSDASGLVVVGLSPDVPQSAVDSHVAEIGHELSGLGLDRAETLHSRRFDVNANWKLVSALSYESYHFATLHRDTVATMFAPSAVYDLFGRHSRWSFALKGTERLKDQERSRWPEALPGVLSYQLFPGTVVIVTWEIGQLIRTEPGPTPDTSVVHYHGVVLDAARREELRANYELGLKAFETEDLPAAVECHQGLRAGRREFFVGGNEPVLQFWCEQWRAALRG